MRIPIYGKVKTPVSSSYRTESTPETYVSKYNKFNNIHSVDVSIAFKSFYRPTFRRTSPEDTNQPTVIGTNNLFKLFSDKPVPHPHLLSPLQKTLPRSPKHPSVKLLGPPIVL